MNRFSTKILSLILCCAFATGLAQPAPLPVVATVGMIGDVAANVGGECVDVTTLMGPGTDPHLYRASAGDVARLGNASLILYGGLQLEGRLVDVLARLDGRVPTVAVMERIDRDLLLEEQEDGATFDPHLWMDAALWARTIDVVAAAIAELRPDCTEALERNAGAYRAELLALHDWARASLASIPAGQRVLITAHDAFYYFARAYDFEASEGVQGISTDAEASVADIRAVVDAIAARGVPAIFPESTVNPRTIEAVQAAARDRGLEVAIGGELYSDAMGDAGTPEGTYIGMIRHNVRTVTEALGGTVAPWPTELAAWAERHGVRAD